MNLFTRASFILLTFTLAACGDVMTTYFKGVSTTAVLAKSCREGLSIAHEKKTDAIKAKAQAGDQAGAKADLEKWEPVYEKAKTACVGLKAAAEEGLAAAPVVEAAVNKKTEVAGWIARLTALALDTAKIVAEAGVKLPEVK